MPNMDNGVVFIDGEFVPASQAKLPVLDSGFMMGTNVFDTMGLWQGHLFRMDAHLDRFFRSLKTVRFSLPYSRAEIEELIVETVQLSGLRDGNVNVIATRGIRQGAMPIEQWDPRFIAMCIPSLVPLSEAKRNAGYRMRISSVRNMPSQTLDPKLKTYNRLHSYLATLEAHDAGSDDAIMLDANGYVTEGPSFNVFTVAGGCLQTPASGVLRGITSDTILKIAKQEHIPTHESLLTPYDLYNADEVFLTSTSRGAVGIVEVDNRVIGSGQPGTITHLINDVYWKWHTDERFATPIYEIAVKAGHSSGSQPALVTGNS